MSDPYIQNLFAERIGGASYGKGTAIYKFAKIKRAKRAALEANPGAELIDMGVGEPDEMAFPDVIDELHKAAKKPDNRGYADNGGPVYQQAAARWMKNVCGVEIADPTTQIIHSIGSKAALSLLPTLFINPGDVALMTTPGYPVFGTHAKYFGGEVYNIPLLEKHKFLPDLDSVPDDVVKRAKTLVINYPNNPTGASATPAFFAKVVEFAKRNNTVVFHDAAYAALVFDGKPLSFLATPGAMDVGVELHSMSKGFNMTGWRLGFVAGNPLIVKAYADVKDNSDSGQFLAIQQACAYALDHPEQTQQIAAKYSRRMDGLVSVLNKHGFNAKKPRGSFFLYVKTPKAATGKDGKRVAFETGEAFSQWMITEKLISTVPWDDAGAYVRFSVTFIAKNEADERRVLGEIDKRLAGSTFEFSNVAKQKPVVAYVALGANLGDPEANIRAAVDALGATPGVRVTRTSSLIENPAVGGPPDSPAFLNGVAEVETTLDAHALLDRLLEIERALGRERRRKWEPRAIDLDLVLYGKQVIDTPELQVPHPLMQERRFVLQPLAELAPDFVHPVAGITVREMLSDLDDPEQGFDEPTGFVSRSVYCIGCRYNLRGLPARGVCPECGRPVSDTVEPERFEAPREGDDPFRDDTRIAEVQAIAKRCGCAPQAALLVRDAMQIATTSFPKLADGRTVDLPPVEAPQVVDAFIGLVRRVFCQDDFVACAMLLKWGIKDSRDVGRIVFAMVEAGWFEATEGDRLEAFDDLFVTTALFNAPPSPE